MRAQILDSDGNVIRIVETTAERAKEKGWVPVGSGPAAGAEMLALYEKYQDHPSASKAHAKVNEALARLERPEEYCTKTAFLGYLNQTELLK